MSRIYAAVGAVLIVIVFVLAGLVVLLKNQLALRTLELATAQETITRQAESINRLTAQRKVDDRIVTELATGLAELKTAAEAQTQALTELEKSDPDVKNFLALPVPDNLRQLLNK